MYIHCSPGLPGKCPAALPVFQGPGPPHPAAGLRWRIEVGRWAMVVASRPQCKAKDQVFWSGKLDKEIKCSEM